MGLKNNEGKMGSQSQLKLTPPGQMVDVGGFRLHTLVCGQGKPAVIFEPALGGFALQYRQMQAGVSAFTRAMAYDRAGQGWSDASPNPRTPIHLAAELHTLLDRVNLQPPYVLVGHSFGGMLARIYAGFHSQEVAGMVLVDATHVDEYASFPDVDRFVRQAAMGVRLIKIVSRLGLGKQLTRLSLGNAAKSFSKEDLEAFLTLASQPKHHETMLAEFSQHRLYFGPQSAVPRSLGAIPLIVVTAENSAGDQGKVAGMTAEQVNAQHQRLQKDLAQLSSHGEQDIILGATHFSILTQPEHVAQVVAAIRRMVEKVRYKSRAVTVPRSDKLS
jgi:pimeloyl-ACP methyl ester carboxylesterase